MTFHDLIPWARGDRSNGLQRRAPYWPGSAALHPLHRLQSEMHRLFEDVLSDFDPPEAGAVWPDMEALETDQGYRVSLELPGMDEKDVEVSFEDGMLVVRGEKRSETEDAERAVTERRYGRFERRIALPDIDQAAASASFDKGVLTVELPRPAEAADRVKRIPINVAPATQH